MLSQQSLSQHSSFQHLAQHEPDQENSLYIAKEALQRADALLSLDNKSEAIKQTLHDTVDDSVVESRSPLSGTALAPTQPLSARHDVPPSILKKFRLGHGEHAAQVAAEIKRLVVTSSEGILHKARLVLDMKLRLNRKEWGVWLSEMLGWFNNEATQYLQIAKAFQDFDPGVFCDLEPFVILKLRTKRYAPVVKGLREQLALTSQMVQDFIKELLPKQSRKKSSEQISGWKRMPSGGGRYYNVLLHDEETGMLIEQQAEAERVLPQRVIASAVALRAQRQKGAVQVSDYRKAQIEEFQDVVDNARELEREKRQLQLELSERDRLIADLQAKLALGVVSPVAESDSEPTNKLTVFADNLNEPKTPSLAQPLLQAIANDNTTQSESTTTPYSDDEKELEQPSENLELALPCDPPRAAALRYHLLEQPESALVLSPGDLVEINVTRPNGDKTWNELRGYIQKLSPATGIAAVLLQGDYRSKHFFLDEQSPKSVSIRPGETTLARMPSRPTS